MRNQFLFYFLLLFVYACNTPSPSPNPTENNTSTTTLTETKPIVKTLKDTTAQSIFTFLFDNFNTENNFAIVSEKIIPDTLLSRFNNSDNDTLIATFEKVIPIEDGRHIAYFKVTPKDGYDCRICAPIMAAGILKNKNGEWKLGKINYFDLAGIYGIAPDVEIIQISPHDYALVAGLGDLHMGYHWSAENYYSVNNNFTEIFSSRTHMDNSGTCDPEGKDADLMTCFENETSIEIIKNPNGYYEIKTHETGTNWDYDKEELIKLDDEKTFVFQDGKYVEKKE